VIVIDGGSQDQSPDILERYGPFDLSTLLPSDWFLPQQSAFFCRQRMDEVGRYLRRELHYTMDRELMYRICREGETVLLPGRILAGDRHHTNCKRLSQSITMYREDTLALSYCTWGDARDHRKRRRVERWRRAQGHYNVARRNPSLGPELYHFIMAACFRPAYLVHKGFIKRVLKGFAHVQPGT
jgi:hypothetical protein